MQENLFFWNAWNKPFRAFYLSLLSILCISILFLGVSYFIGDTLTIGWEKDVDLETTAIPVETQTIDFFNYSLETNVYISRSWLNNASIKTYPAVAYAYLFIITAAILVLITIFTFLDLAYFLIGMTAIIAFIISLNTDLLGIFGLFNRSFSVFLIVSYLGLAYWIHAFQSSMYFFKRLQLFTALTIVSCICIGFFSSTPLPLYQVAQSSLLASFIAIVLFLFLIGFENIRTFFYITAISSQHEGKKNLLHFSIISIAYIGNTFLLFTKGKIFQTDLGLVLIHPLFIFLAAGLLGIYGYKKRSVLFSDTLPFKPLGAFFYLCLFIIATTTLGYAYFSANDALYNSIEYMTILTQLCLSICFFLYVWINFAAPMLKNLKVYPFLFEAKYTPLFIVQGLGIIGVFGLVALSHYFPYKQAMASHYVQLGDYFISTEDTTLAKQYYFEAHLWDNLCHRSNYALAQIAEKEDRWDVALEHYDASLRRKASPYAIIGLSGVYQHQKQLFPSFFMLKDGNNLFPNSGAIKNNLGLMYDQLNLQDSAQYMLQEAYADMPSDAGTNMLYLMLKSGNYANADSTIEAIGTYSDIPFENNLLALQSALGKSISSSNFETLKSKDSSALTPELFTNMYNYSVNHLTLGDSNFTNQIDTWIQTEHNSSYRDELLSVKSLNQYYGTKNKCSALITFHELATQHPTTAYYPKVLAQWYVSKHRFDLAAEYYFKAINNRLPQLQPLYVLSLLESHQYERAKPYIEEWLTSPEQDKATIAKLVQSVASIKNTKEALDQGDLIKLRYIRWNITKQSLTERTTVAQSIENKEIKAQAYLSLIEEHLNMQQHQEALALWNALEKSNNVKPETMAWGDELYLKLLVALQDWETLKTKSANTSSDSKAYYTAINALMNQDSTNAAKQFVNGLSNDPLDETLAARALFFLGERDFMGYYDLILAQIMAYPESVKISEAYMILCINNIMDSYATGELQRIEPYLTNERYLFWKEKIKNKSLID